MFNLIRILIIRPIVNILFVIYNYVGDFGVAIIIFTVLAKLAMWPLMKRQLHQTRIMRQIQPELAEIKKRCKGNRQAESLQMMDLYKRKNIKPFRTVLMTFIQLPIFIAIFRSINVFVRPIESEKPFSNVSNSAYEFIKPMHRINEAIQLQHEYFNEQKEVAEAKKEAEEKGEDPNAITDATYKFEPSLFGVIDLSVTPNSIFKNFNASTVVVALFALLSAAAQFIMAKQQDPSRKKGAKKRSMRELMRQAAEGKEADQDEINAVAQSQMTYMMPCMMLMIMINLPGALVMYYLLSNIITISLQKVILNRNYEEMEEAADKKILKELRAQEAEIVEKKGSSDEKDSKSHYSNNKNKKENVHITRIKASDNKKKRR